MDTSKKYIEMCQKAQEIQNYYKEKLFGDPSFFAFQCTEYFCKQCYSQFYNNESFCSSCGGKILEKITWEISDDWDEKTIWLPRQDQLQEITGHSTGMSKHLWFADWIDENFTHYTKQEAIIIDDTSLEQFWLMYIMEKKFSKAWDGKNWNVKKHLKKMENKMTNYNTIRISGLNVDVIKEQILFITETMSEKDDFPQEHEFFKSDAIGFYKIVFKDYSFLRVNNKLMPRKELINLINRK